ncbi:536990c9-d2c6-4d05-980b-aaab1fa32765 [Thermothielavioides terrestris]|uniref:536990c9-d2c6-4d05-980b-aaab1fa32765 n=1 Tax=Thermothielavioides terrestris TaxID=2587410 RepID=A0A3S4B4A3_9PEZI|nr:536990c9-d2c6-4d05-980b-aaab1fa32765 [Thermothielavioides terrestris]
MLATTLLTAALTLTPFALGAAVHHGASPLAARAPTAAPTSSPSPPKSFIGKGQLRTRWNDGDYADLGCLTDGGQWTANETLCGVFTGAPLAQPTGMWQFTLTTAEGGCYIIGSEFKCDHGNPTYPTAYYFWVYPLPNAIPGVDCLGYSQYGLMASDGKNPPSPEDPPEEIHLVSYSEVGKYVWLTWRALE